MSIHVANKVLMLRAAQRKLKIRQKVRKIDTNVKQFFFTIG